MILCCDVGGPKGLVGLRWREGMDERFGMDRTKAMGTNERKDNMSSNEEMELEDLSVTY